MPNAVVKGKVVSENRAASFIIFSALLGSFGAMLTRLLPWNPVVLFGLRAGTCALALLIYMRGLGNIRFTKQTVLCSLILTVAGLLYILALRMTTVANASVFKFTSSIWLVLISALFLRVKYRRRDYIAVLIAFAGIVLFFFDRLDFTQLLGNFIGLGCGMLMGLQLVVYSRFDSVHTTMSTMFIAQPIGFLISLPFLLFIDPPEWSWPRLGILLLVGVVSLAIPNILYSFAVQYCPPLRVGLVSLIEPLLSPLWALVFLREAPGLFSIIGGVVVLATITVWTVLGARDKAAQAASAPANVIEGESFDA